ncbi:SAG1386/EF1546 family surface-associated protein [Enterococcus sp. LJL99]
MSKQDKKRTTEVREPWEQSIYETDREAGASRVGKRQNKKGNTAFLTILVILLLLIISLPIGTWMYISRDKKPAENTANSSQASSSVVQSSTTTSESTSVSSSSEEQQNSSSSSEPATDGGNETPEQTPEAEAAAEYTTVLAGEGFQQVAARNGITVAQLEQLNGKSSTETIYPGETLRVK